MSSVNTSNNSFDYPVNLKYAQDLDRLDSDCTMDLPLHKIKYAGSHNAAITSADNWNYSQQKWPVIKQLELGVRFLELDIAKNAKGRIKICHGESWSLVDPQRLMGGDYKNCSDQLREIVQWLHNNPKEILIIKLDNARDKTQRMNDVDALFKEDPMLADMTFTPAILERMGDSDKGWPTQRELVGINKRIVFINFLPPQSEDEISKYTHFAGDVLREGPGGGVDYVQVKSIEKNQVDGKLTPYRSQKWAEKVQRDYTPRSDENKLVLIPHGSQISSQTLASVGKAVAAPVNTVANLFGYKGRVLKDDKMELSDNNPLRIREIEKKYKEADEYTHRDPNVTMVDFVNMYLRQDAVKLINEINRKTAEEHKQSKK